MKWKFPADLTAAHAKRARELGLHSTNKAGHHARHAQPQVGERLDGGRVGRKVVGRNISCTAHGGCPLGSARLFGVDESTVG
jgi:hypothetical protein